MNTPSNVQSKSADEPLLDEPRAHPNRARSASYIWVAPAVTALIAFGVIFGETRRYGLLGYDSYPIILTSRVQSFADFMGNFTEKLMDGRYFNDFYRPLLNFSFALDYALWRLRPIGYQLTNALLFAGCAVALFALVRRLVGPRAFIAPLVAMLFFLLHPAHVEVIPVPPRRADLLCCLFLALSLTSQLSPKALAMKRPPILPAIFGLLAIASKESGLILPALAYAAVLLYSPRSKVWKRALHAATAIIPHVLVTAVMVAARIAVIGDIGGHRATVLSYGPDRFPSAFIETGRLLLFPQAVMQKTSLAGWLAGAVVLGVTITGILTLATRRPHRPGRRPVRAAVLGGLWAVLVSATYIVAAQIEPWYLFLPVAGLAVFVAGVTDGLAAALRRGAWPARITAAATLLLLLGLVGWQARYSPFFQKYDEYERATTASDTFFEELRKRIEATPNGAAILAPPMPRWVRPRPDQPTVFGAAILMDYSVQAWAELTYPNRRIRVTGGPRAMIGRPAPDELLVVLRALRSGFENAAPLPGPEPQPY
jgi:hypothetical protein